MAKDATETRSPILTAGRVLLLIAGAMWQVALAVVLQKGWLNDLPDWIVVTLCLIPVLALIIWVVIHEKTRKHVYTSPKMSFVFFVSIGTTVGFLVSAFIWWALYIPHGSGITVPVTADKATSQPSPSPLPAVTPLAMASSAPSPSSSSEDASNNRLRRRKASKRDETEEILHGRKKGPEIK